MDRYDPSKDRPSIFPGPDPSEDERRPPPTLRPARVRRVQPAAGSRATLIAVGVAGLLLIAVGGFVAGAILTPGDDIARAGASSSAEPSSEASASVPISPEPSAAPSEADAPAASPTASAPPDGPPQQLAVGGWATVTVGELNVRPAPDLDGTPSYRLIRGAVVHVQEGPVGADGLDWYRATSLGGVQGWVASGLASAPFLGMLSEDDTLMMCGAVTGDVLVAGGGGAPRAADAIHVGDLTLPASAFDSIELGTLELIRSIQGEACASALIGPDGLPVIYADLFAIACGSPAERDGGLVLRPAIGQDVVSEYQVKDTALVHPDVLSGRPGDEAQAADMRGVFLLAAREGDGVHRCIHTRTSESPDGVQWFRQIDGKQCAVVDSWTPGNAVIRPETGGDAVTLTTVGGNAGIPTGAPVGLLLTGWAFSDGDQSMVVQTSAVTGCG